MDLKLPWLVLFILIGCIECSPDDNHHPSGPRRYEYCVLGAGPSGLQMGYFLSKAKRDYVILERNSRPGSFFNKYPRHRKLISINKIYTGSQNREFNMRHDWNSLLSDRADLLFKQVSRDFFPHADTLPVYLSMFEKELGLKVRYGVDIGRIRAMLSPSGRSYVLTDQHESDYNCSVLLVATGLWDPQKVEFVGSEFVEGYDSISTDPEDYKDQTVLILGKGNSAFETAQNILGRTKLVHMYSASPIRLAWQTHYVGDVRAVNNEVIDTYQLKSLDGLLEGSVEAVSITKVKDQGRRPGSKKKGELYVQRRDPKAINSESHAEDNFSLRLPYDRVISCIGFRFNFSIFDRSARLMNSDNARGRLPKLTAWYEGEKTPGLFVLGTATHSRDYRFSAGSFIHGFRYTVRSIHRVLERRYHSNPWQSTKMPTTQLLSQILKRINEASGLYQMFEVLGDVILLRGSHFEYLEEFPIQALPQFSSLSGHEVSHHGLIVVVFQYGKKKIDYLGRARSNTDWMNAWHSSFLHPVLYYYDTLPTVEEMKLRPSSWSLPRPKLVHAMVEDFITDWSAPISHIQPLRRFLDHCLQTDLRTFYADSCFRLSLTHRKPPLFCQQGYLKGQGVPRSSEWASVQHQEISASAKLDALGAEPAYPNFLAQTGASISSGQKLDF
ncbi:FAD-dependent oxidoreductase domain-containing protein 2 [Clinocottus analis]|uniref:FAD-dependent oxidoreductase domain-containing protein 2 n=1 Tax=Clinocottus analis TaxID=304258 RepID=UPI0035BED1AC